MRKFTLRRDRKHLPRTRRIGKTRGIYDDGKEQRRCCAGISYIASGRDIEALLTAKNGGERSGSFRVRTMGKPTPNARIKTHQDFVLADHAVSCGSLVDAERVSFASRTISVDSIEGWRELTDVRQMLLTVATAARAFLLSCWQDWHHVWGPPEPSTLSQWTCVRSSLLLARALERQGFPTALRSGHLFTGEEWASHAWVEAAGSIIDVTADQFGHAPVVITSAENPVYRLARDKADELTPTRAGIAAVDKIWPSWCSYADQHFQPMQNF